ncbi:MAG: N-6 DNA methylase [Archangium sp.]|nr:N-6 DNA methylase [Archangium sp.]
MDASINIDRVVNQLRRIGYGDQLLKSDYRFGVGSESRSVPWAAFAHQPADARSACIALVGQQSVTPPVAQLVSNCRGIGAPVVFECSSTSVGWWAQKASGTQLLERIDPLHLPNFFESHRLELSPSAIFRAKIRGRFEAQHQLSFVDYGLLPVLEGESGTQLARLLERAFLEVRTNSHARRQTMLHALFWLLAAKIMKDKGVIPFTSLDLTDIEQVFPTVSQHYRHPSPAAELTRRELAMISGAARIINDFSSLAQVTTESLGYLYESSLVSTELRSALGIHSTPAYLVEYIVSKLTPHIEAIPQAHRHVLEPACGHGGFLVAAMRVLKDLLPDASDTAANHTYLREHLTGIEIDPFAAEIARLSLTLADIPHPDGWDIRNSNMFDEGVLGQAAGSATILLSNPPYEKFDRRHTKAAEMLARCLPRLRAGSVVGVVVPQGLLHQHGASDVRQMLVRDFDIEEVLALSDKVFRHADVETAVVIAKRRDSAHRPTFTKYRRVREADAARFAAELFAPVVSTKQIALTAPEYDLRAVELEDVWTRAPYRLDHYAESGQGLSHHSTALPKGMVVSDEKPFRGSAPGFLSMKPNIELHGLPAEVHLNLDPRSILRPRSGLPPGRAQLVLNYSPVSRGPWRLKALIDRGGHAVTTRFHVIRPKEDLSLELFWALCNSPYANAYAYTHSTKLHITSGVLRALPVPRLTRQDSERIAPKVREYFRTARAGGKVAQEVLLEIDAQILELYALPPRLERRLLDTFAGHRRPGVPFDFNRYYPDDFQPALPLGVFLKSRESTGGRLLKAATKPWSESIVEGLGIANARHSDGEPA